MWVFPHQVREEESEISIEITTQAHRADHRLQLAHLQISNFHTMFKQHIVRKNLEVLFLLVYFCL
jgi:hypothetical protein